MNATTPTNRLALFVAFGIVYIVWGSTYLANIIAIETIPPFTLIVARLLVAGLFLLSFAKISARGKTGDKAWTWPTRMQWCNLAITSFLFLTIGLGGIVWAEQYIESGTTALLVAAEPLLVVLVLWGYERKRPRWQAFVGVALGIIGTIVLVGQDIVIEGEGAWMGIVAIMVAILAWAFGSVLTSRLSLPQNRVQTAGLQMLIAGALSVPFVLGMGELDGFSIAEISQRSIIAYCFLVVFGSIIAYSAFLYLLQNVSPEKVASSTYVHPVVALSLGVLFRDEIVSNQTMVACGILLAGVLFVNGNWGRRKRSALVQPRQANSPAIKRRWIGKAFPGKADDLETFIAEVVIPDMRATKGNLEAVVTRPFGKTSDTVAVESKWADESALGEFTKGEFNKPKFYKGQEGLIDSDAELVENKEEDV